RFRTRSQLDTLVPHGQARGLYITTIEPRTAAGYIRNPRISLSSLDWFLGHILLARGTRFLVSSHTTRRPKGNLYYQQCTRRRDLDNGGHLTIYRYPTLYASVTSERKKAEADGVSSAC